MVLAEASVAPAAPVGPPVAVPPERAASAKVSLLPSHVGALAGQAPSVVANAPLRPHVLVAVAKLPAAPLVQV